MKRREMIIDFINDYLKKHGYAPSIREIGDGVGLKSSSTVQGHLERLKRDGLVDFRRGYPRTLRILS